MALKRNGEDIKVGHPHMEWNGEEFVPKTPSPSPYLPVEATMMQAAHSKLGVTWQGSRKGAFSTRRVQGLADTGCQTCTAGLDFIELMGCPKSYLVPTSHKIRGITKSGLGIIGSIMVRFDVGGRKTRQMVHVSDNIRGLYLSETALMELGIIHRNFPQCVNEPDDSEYMACPCTSIASACCVDDGAEECLERTPAPCRPEKIPFPPTKENIPKLEKWLLETFERSAFNTCTHQPLQSMTGVPMKAVQKKEGADHPAWYSPIPVAFHWKKQVKADLDRDVRLGIIERVPQGETSEWCSRMVITSKSNGKPRRTIDFQQLNKVTLREVHHTPSPINLVTQVPAGKLKTVLDAWNGYHSLMLDLESKELTTFNTEWGRYRYLRGPQGFHGTGDAYTRRFDDITSGEERYFRCIDDGLLYDDEVAEAFWHVYDHIKLCADNGIVFNPDKFKFARESVEFAGFEVTMDGYRPANHLIEGIRDFPTPRSLTDIRAWFGLVQHVAYAFSETEVMLPFRELRTKKRPFYWDESLDIAFRKSKEEIIRQIFQGVRAYDLRKPTCLATDWSKMGLGFSLMQKHCKCSGLPDPNCGLGHWKLVFAGSKTTNESQSRYSPTEGECLAAMHGLQRCRMYTLGCPNLILATDHNPLTGILNDRRLDSIDNPRLLSLKEKTLAYDFRVVYVKGTSNAIKAADALSRNAIQHQEVESSKEVEGSTVAFAVRQAAMIESVTWRVVNEAASVDEECVALVQLVTEGFPESKDDIPEGLRKYWDMRNELYVIGNVPFKNKKMLIPQNLRRTVLEGLHAGHQGTSSMLANARARLFWPGLDAAVRQLRNQCTQCNEQAPSQREEPAIVSRPPEYPFEQAVADLFHMEGHTFLAYADRYSGWLEVERLQNADYRNVHISFLRWFRTYGVPEEIATDGGPPFKSHDYRKFLQTWGVERRLSSAYYPRSNGRAEAAVKSAKRILLGNVNPLTGKLDTDAAARALMAHRNTPTQDSGIAPSVMLFGRPLRDHLPVLNRKLRTEWDAIAVARETALAKRVLKATPSPRKELAPLGIGDCVQVQNQTGNYPGKWFNTGVISEVLPHRQYNVVVDGSRRISLRNRRFLKRIEPVCRKQVEFPEVIRTSPDEPVIHEPVVHTIPNDVMTPDTSIVPADRPVDPIETVLPIRKNTVEQQRPARRSTRERVPFQRFSAKLRGKTHDTPSG